MQSISTGYFRTCAITVAGALWSWGYNLYGQIGDGTVINRLVPTAVAGLSSGVQTIAAGRHTCASTRLGAAWCWGYNLYGQIGDGSSTNAPSPVLVIELPDLIFRHGFE